MKNETKILAHTKDYCALWTNNILEAISKMSDVGWTIVDSIQDDYIELGDIKEAYVLCFAKGETLDKIME